MNAPVFADGTIGFALSADSRELLARTAAEVAGYVESHPDVPIEDVAYALSTLRASRRQRALIRASDRSGLLGGLRDVSGNGSGAEGYTVHAGTPTAGRPAFVYPGQGSQRPGMGRLYYELSPVYRRSVDETHEASLALFGTSPRDYVLGEYPVAEDAPVDVVQPGIFMQMLGMVAMWNAAGVRADVHVGHSQGEIAAAVAAGVISLRDGLSVVTCRARTVLELAPGGYSMAVLGIDRETTAAILARRNGFVEHSVVNSAHIQCVSGERDEIDTIVAGLGEQGVFARAIRVAYPAHTSIVAQFTAGRDAHVGDLESGVFADSGQLCIGGTLGGPITPEYAPVDYWFWNLRNPVRFDLATAAALEAGADSLIEVSEHPTLQLALMENIADAQSDARVYGTSRRDAEDLTVFSDSVAQVLLRSKGFDLASLAGDRGVIPEDFPPAPMARTASWAPAVRPSRRVAPHPRPRRLTAAWVDPGVTSAARPRPLAVLDPSGAVPDFAVAVVAAAERYGATARRAAVAETGETALLVLPAAVDPVAAADALLADRSWWASDESPAAEVWLVTRGAVDTGDDSVPEPAQAAAAAGLRALAADLPGLRVRHCDVGAQLSDADAAWDAVTGLHVAAEPRVAVRAGTPLVCRLVSAGPDPAEAASLDHVIITGGTGFIGTRVCRDLAARGARRITLLSRSGDTADVRRTLAPARRTSDTEIVVRACDVTDPSAVAEALAGAPDATLVVHAAVGYADTPTTEIEPGAFARASAAKVGGLETLLKAASLADDARIVACSSLAATVPGRGQALYAAANALLDAEIAALRAAGRAAAAVQWGLWETAGPLDEEGFARVAGTGVVPMAAPDALAAIDLTSCADAVVLAADLPRLRVAAEVLGVAPLLEGLGDDGPVPDAGSAAAACEPDPDVALSADPAPSPDPASPASASSAADPGETLRARLAHVLGMGPEELDADVPLVALGLDSLQALELRTAVRTELGRDLPLEAVLGGATLADMTAALAEQTS
ncbi:SDR family NAD(P)-dependent oxidoreductase [Tsukamurella sp. 8F]|uniref:SDR family NAD(P)-dependent oxidoreductase n=1 Tax=unclassified Tsukamurella TaxID=2633480 RepID=UPI0023B94815|nr:MULTISPECIES: SDR family NAD(P)-dependent oxidoreductase [unclassified Tsukamurella]MDF0529308.1 SDR family NAD(P)-dependent oxidoreductase [Tsukamurella sp. 8J]MDF0587185.1 SDR family NAD(P)-dependent oxidoreductase [Tsukamurella sp. 8F]